MKKRAETYKKECHHFDLPVQSFSALDDLHEDIIKTVSSWQMYKQFSEEMEDLAKKDWLSMNQRLYTIEDVLSKWSDSLKGLDIDVVVRFLLSQVDRLKKNVPYLKFVKGDGFTTEHWSALFRLLQMPKEVKKAADLTLQHFLDSSDLVVKKMEQIKDLQARATAELTIQEALDELLKWGNEASFSVIEQMDSSGRAITLIKVCEEASSKNRYPVFLSLRNREGEGERQEEKENVSLSFSY